MDQHPLLRKFVTTKCKYTGRDLYGRLLKLGPSTTGATIATIKIAKTKDQLYFVDIDDVKKATYRDQMWSKLKETAAR